MTWLASLPHQIPFRAASTGRRIDDKTIAGTFLCTANDPLPEIMLAEAMAQLAGGLVFDAAQHGFLSGIDDFELGAVVPGDVVRIIVHLDAQLGGVFRFSSVGSIDGLEVAHGRFYLAAHENA